MENQTILTPEGHKKLLKELESLRAKRKEISNRIEEAKELGDLSENAEYHEAKNDQAFAEGRIAEIEATLNSATIVDKKDNKDGVVGVGSTVKAIHEGSETTFTIVGANEADPTQGKISNESPLGRELLGKKVHDSVKVTTPKGEKEYQIIHIS